MAAGTTTDRPPDSSNPARLELSVRATPEAIAEVRRRIETFAGVCGLNDKAATDAGLCVNEAMANIIVHAYGGASDGRIDITAEMQERQICITLRDWGTGVNPAALPPRPYHPGEPGGLGLLCICSLMDKVRYIPQTDGMLMKMWKTRT